MWESIHGSNLVGNHVELLHVGLLHNEVDRPYEDHRSPVLQCFDPLHDLQDVVLGNLCLLNIRVVFGHCLNVSTNIFII